MGLGAEVILTVKNKKNIYCGLIISEREVDAGKGRGREDNPDIPGRRELQRERTSFLSIVNRWTSLTLLKSENLSRSEN